MRRCVETHKMRLVRGQGKWRKAKVERGNPSQRMLSGVKGSGETSSLVLGCHKPHPNKQSWDAEYICIQGSGDVEKCRTLHW